MISFNWLQVLLTLVGILLILASGYLYFRQWSHYNMRTREYSYISETERGKRTFRAGLAAVVFMFGICFILSGLSEGSTYADTIIFLIIGVCASPFVLLGMIFRMRKDLEPYTKMEDDVVFLSKDNGGKL